MFIVDADAHVEECEATWEYLEPEFRRYRPIPVRVDADTYNGSRNAFWVIAGKVYPKQTGRGWFTFATPPTSAQALSKPQPVPSQTLTDVSARLRDMDRFGINIQVIVPTLFLVALADDDPKLEKALCRSYNRFMANACNQSGGRLRYIAAAPLRDMADAVEVVREAKDLGAVGVLSPGVVWDRPQGDQLFNPLYEELSNLDIPLVLHFSWGAPALTNLFTDKASSFSAAILPVVMGFYSMMVEGVFERYPRLKVAFLEAGIEWLPFTLRRLDDRYNNGRLPWLSRKPSEQARSENIFFACQADEDVAYVLRFIGEHQLVMASDYPHSDDSSEENLAAALERRGDLSEESRRKILGDNPLRLYGLSIGSASLVGSAANGRNQSAR